MSTIYRQGPQQPWINRVVRSDAPARITALAPYDYEGVTQRTVFNARPTSHHGNQQGTVVVLSRARAEALTLPRRQNASPMPQGSDGKSVTGYEPPDEDFGHYGDGWYGDGWYGL